MVDPAVSGQTALDVMSAYVYPQSDLGKRLDPKTNPTLFHLARALEVDLASPAQYRQRAGDFVVGAKLRRN